MNSIVRNAIRGLLMHLCQIPTDKIHLVEIPTGLPLVFDSRLKGIRLLDDGNNSPTNPPFVRYFRERFVLFIMMIKKKANLF